jgi:hypothetical protein
VTGIALPMTGGCQCGAVRYAIDAQPLTVLACHCGECQKQSASAFGMTMPVPRESLRITKGEPAHWSRTADSGNVVGGVLCATCGSRLYHEPANKALLNVKAGTLDDTGWVTPVAHIWTETAQPWIRAKLDGLIYPKQHPSLDPLIAAWRERTAG